MLISAHQNIETSIEFGENTARNVCEFLSHTFGFIFGFYIKF